MVITIVIRMIMVVVLITMAMGRRKVVRLSKSNHITGHWSGSHMLIRQGRYFWFLRKPDSSRVRYCKRLLAMGEST